MPIEPIDPGRADFLLRQGAVLVDIRDVDEYARERIPQSVNMPLAQLCLSALPAGSEVIFHCRSGLRTQRAAEQLAEQVTCQAYWIEGGLDAWKRQGLPVERDPSQPLELMRQVQIVAGSLALAGTLLGSLLSPWFFVLPGLVGAGLMFAGITGFCGMARLLLRMPWNRSFQQREFKS
ncbi:MAG: rhodanese family protein [Corticimicrobacter sp.]|uniref:rhodanese family protein n=1 Tax=Corticimicrobacter sp. TaxID=2678536 RepID=UPI0032DB36B7